MSSNTRRREVVNFCKQFKIKTNPEKKPFRYADKNKTEIYFLTHICT